MKILINASNLSGGGGAQVADSICSSLYKYPQHSFILIFSENLSTLAQKIASFPNVKTKQYNYPTNDWESLIFHRNKFLDNLVEQEKIQCVLTIFGPMKWKPKIPHLSGFALAHIVMPESPYFTRMRLADRIKWIIKIKVWEYIFKHSADNFYTENKLITDRLQEKFKNKHIYTITNYYNQVFDNPSQWKYHKLPPFNGYQFLDIASAGGHKNLNIAIDIAKYLKQKYPNFQFRFIFTISKDEYPQLAPNISRNFLLIGKVDISECPSLYEQCDIAFQPTLLECFTATYPEAMRMKKPIVTTSLPFAKGLCGEAAEYFSPVSAIEAAEALYRVSTDKELYNKLINKGMNELNKFDSYSTRIDKLISICEQIGKH